MMAKTFLILLTSSILVISIGSIYLNYLINKRFREIVADSSKGLYQVEYSKANFNILTAKLTIHDFELKGDSNTYRKMVAAHKAPRYLINGSAKELVITKLSWIRYYFSKKIHAGTFSIINPIVHLTRFKDNEKDTVPNSPSTIDEMILQGINSLELNNFLIVDAVVNYRNQDNSTTKSPAYKFEKFNLNIDDLAIRKKDNNDSGGVSFSNYKGSLSQFKRTSEDRMYVMQFDNLRFNSGNPSVEIDSMMLKPILSRNDYGSKVPYQKTRSDLKLDKMVITGLDMNSVLDKGEIHAKDLKIGGGYWKLFLNRNAAVPPAKTQVVPTQKLLNLPIPILVDTLRVTKFLLRYEELSPNAESAGLIFFSNLNATLSNITNIPSQIRSNNHLLANFNTRLMDKGDFKVNFDFLLDDTTGQFSVKVQLNGIDAVALNPIFIPLNKLEITKGRIGNLKASGSGNENQASGDVSLLYKDLHVDLLKEDKNADTMKKKTLASMVANIMIWNDNPRENEPVRAAKNIAIRRAPNRSFFNMLFMVIFTGVGEIVVKK